MTTQKATTTEPKELNLETKVTVRSIAGWDTYFSRITEVGDVRITPNGTIRLSRNEIIAQVQNGNRLFAGIDGLGGHATLYIEDEPTRIELGFDQDGKKQNILTDEKAKSLFAIKQQEEFEATYIKEVITRAEEYALIQIIKRLGLNDYRKIRFIEKYSGFNLD